MRRGRDRWCSAGGRPARSPSGIGLLVRRMLAPRLRRNLPCAGFNPAQISRQIKRGHMLRQPQRPRRPSWHQATEAGGRPATAQSPGPARPRSEDHPVPSREPGAPSSCRTNLLRLVVPGPREDRPWSRDTVRGGTGTRAATDGENSPEATQQPARLSSARPARRRSGRARRARGAPRRSRRHRRGATPAASSTAAARNSSASVQGLPISCTPIGSAPSACCTGAVTTGKPRCR